MTLGWGVVPQISTGSSTAPALVWRNTILRTGWRNVNLVGGFAKETTTTLSSIKSCYCIPDMTLGWGVVPQTTTGSSTAPALVWRNTTLMTAWRNVTLFGGFAKETTRLSRIKSYYCIPDIPFGWGLMAQITTGSWTAPALVARNTSLGSTRTFWTLPCCTGHVVGALFVEMYSVLTLAIRRHIRDIIWVGWVRGWGGFLFPTLLFIGECRKKYSSFGTFCAGTRSGGGVVGVWFGCGVGRRVSALNSIWAT